MRVLFVCGSRDRHPHADIREIIKSFDPDYVMHGGARGTDKAAHDCALDAGRQPIRLDANWDVHERSAGPIRNGAMANMLVALRGGGWTIACHAFPGDGPGTKDMMKCLDARGISVIVHPPKGES